MSTLIGKMLIEEDIQLTPQLKKMKLNSKSDSLNSELNRSNYMSSDPKDHLKTVFPYFSEEKLQEILDKSSQNIESAQKVILEMKLAEKKNDKDFVNLHQTERKRKFRDLQNSTMSFGVKSEENTPQISTQNSLENSRNYFFSSNSETGRKLLNIKSAKPKFVQNNFTGSSLSDLELEKLINEVSVLNSRDEIKYYLRQKISNLINSAPDKIQTVNSDVNPQISDTEEKKVKKSEIKQKLENLVNDNNSLKKSVVTLYRKYEEFKNKAEENTQLKKQIQTLQNELSREKSKNQTMAMLLRQYDTSTRFDLHDLQNIY